MRQANAGDLLRSLAHRSGLVRLARASQRAKMAVLMYHGVLPDDDPLAEGDWLQVRLSEFRAQMAYLAENYSPCSVDQAFAPATPESKPRALVTFDDGYANNLRFALPVLQEFRVPAIIFLVTGHIGTQKLFWWDRLHLGCQGAAPPLEQIDALKRRNPRDIKAALDAYLHAKGLEAPDSAPESYRTLNRKELQQLHDTGLISFGSHTHGHEILDTLSDEEASATIEVAAERLAAWGIPATHFAAPNGGYRDDQVRLMQAAGHASCFATRPGLWQAPGGPYDIPRIGIGRGTKIPQFAAQLADLKGWLGFRPTR